MKTGFAAVYRRYSGLFFGGLALLIVLAVLFWGDNIGLSNNGDFNRVMRAASLSYGDVTPSYTYAEEYVIELSGDTLGQNLRGILFSREGLESYPSVHVALVRLAVAANVVFNTVLGREPSAFSMGFLGVLYALLYAAGIGLLCRNIRLRRLGGDMLVKLALLFVLCDVGYVAYFNSLYGEALEHVALVWCAAGAVRLCAPAPSVRDGLFCGLSALVYGWAKFFNIPLAVLFALVTAGVIFFRGGRRPAALLPGLLAAALLLGVWSAVPEWMDRETNYNSLFYGVLRDVDEETARRYLADMGLPEELSGWRDTNYYLDGAVSSMKERGLWEAAGSVGKAELIGFYLTHPARLFHQAKITAMHSGMIRPYYLANYGEGYPLLTYSGRMSGWSRLRNCLAFDSLWGNLALWAAFFLLAVSRLRRETKGGSCFLPVCAVLGALAYAFLMPVMLNGEGDLAKHMFAYIELADMLFIACLAMVLDGRGQSRRTRLGAVILLAAGLLLPPVARNVSAAVETGKNHSEPEAGAYVRFGSYGGEPLVWLVTAADGDELTLWSVREDIVLAFDGSCDNDWRYSTVRVWLQTAFLSEFTDGQLALLRERDNTLILSDRYRSQAERGDLDFACNHIPALAARGYERAYQITVTDMVTLPDIDLAAALAEQGLSMGGAEFWLETPYCPQDCFVRYMGEDGHIYFGPADLEKAVRPVISIAGAEPVSGRGSLDDPFVIG